MSEKNKYESCVGCVHHNLEPSYIWEHIKHCSKCRRFHKDSDKMSYNLHDLYEKKEET